MNWKTGLIGTVILLVVLLVTAWQLTPRVEGFEPSQGALHARQSLEIVFSRPMDPNSIPDRFNLQPDIPGDLTWNEEGDRFIFTPREAWPPGETIELKIQSGTRSTWRLPTLRDYQHTLEVGPHLLAYLWPAEGASNLFLANPETGDSQALTEEPEGILDYSVALDGLTIFFSRGNQDGTSSIFTLDRTSGQSETVLDCQEGLCLSPRLSPDGIHLAFEFIPQSADLPPGVRVLDLEEEFLINPGDENDHLESPSWSSSGILAYYNQSQKGYGFWDPATEDSQFLPNETGGDGTWSPDGRFFVCTEIQFTSQTLAPRHLLLFDLEEETLQDLTRGRFLEDLNPSFAPQELILAFSRKSLEPQAWSPGRQLWLMNILNNESTQLTDAADYHHSSFAWHPDGSQLAYVRYNQAALSEPPEIWLIKSDGSDNLRLIINGFAPSWIP